MKQTNRLRLYRCVTVTIHRDSLAHSVVLSHILYIHEKIDLNNDNDTD